MQPPKALLPAPKKEIPSAWKWSGCVTLLLTVNTIKCKNPNKPRAPKSHYIATVITNNT